MKLIATALLFLLASCSAVAPTAQNAATTRDSKIAIYLGQRNLDEDDWEPVDQQAMFGIEYSRETAGSPIGFEVGIMGSADSDELNVFGTDFDIDAKTAEIYGGVKKTFGSDVVRPYVGGGLSFIKAEVDIDGVGDDDDSSIAAYLHGGIGFQLTEMFSLGLDLRFLFGSDIELLGEDADADYGQFSIFAAFGF